jgi:hypothetical protein
VKRDDPDGNVLTGLAIGALLSVPVWMAVWLLVKYWLG